MGPTASGKTDLAIALSKKLPIDVISVDSALIYRDMNIGTAKPTAEELAQTPHALIDICDPADTYSAADFCRDAHKEIAKSINAGRIPLLVGGTMMYFNALLEGLADMPATDEATRNQIDLEAEQKGWPALHDELLAVDPNHSHRIARALAVYRISGQTMTVFRQQQAASSLLRDQYDIVQFALMPTDRSWLHQRIKQRYELMLQHNFIDEVKRLRARGDLNEKMPSIRSVGYRQVWQYLSGDYDYDVMVEKGLAATRQLAKRQLTWLRGWESVHLLSVDVSSTASDENCEENLKNILNFLPIESI